MNQSKWITVVLVVFIIIIGVFWYAQHRPATVKRSAVDDSIIQIPVQVDRGNLTDTSDWKTYRNEEYGFEVKYPSSWGLVERTRSEFDGSVIQLVSSELQEAVKAKKVDYSCDWSISYYSEISDEPENKLGGLAATTMEEMISRNHMITPIGKTILGGKPAIDVVWGGSGAYYTILSDYGNHLYSISSCSKERRDTLTATEMTILANFQFIK